MSVIPRPSTIDLANLHVLRGREIVANQRRRIEQLKAKGRDVDISRDLLASFEETLRIFEVHLAFLSSETGDLGDASQGRNISRRGS